jgi:DNA-binding NtrC family response regulator
MNISPEEQGKIRALATMAARPDADRLDVQELMEQAWSSGAAYCHRFPEVEVQEVQRRDNLAEIERETILRVYAECGENFKESTARLGIGKTTLFRKLKEYGFQRKHTRGVEKPHACPRCGYEYDDQVVPESPKTMAATGCQ